MQHMPNYYLHKAGRRQPARRVFKAAFICTTNKIVCRTNTLQLQNSWSVLHRNSTKQLWRSWCLREQTVQVHGQDTWPGCPMKRTDAVQIAKITALPWSCPAFLTVFLHRCRSPTVWCQNSIYLQPSSGWQSPRCIQGAPRESSQWGLTTQKYIEKKRKENWWWENTWFLSHVCCASLFFCIFN